MLVVVADASPLHYLVLIERAALLPALFGTVHVPREVLTELSDDGAPSVVRGWVAALPAWIEAHPVTAPVADPLLLTLDDGERAAIALAGAIHADLLLIDERAGAAVAETKGFAVTGTLGVLRRAARRDLIDLPSALAALQATNFHVRQALIDRLLAEDRERRQSSSR